MSDKFRKKLAWIIFSIVFVFITTVLLASFLNVYNASINEDEYLRRVISKNCNYILNGWWNEPKIIAFSGSNLEDLNEIDDLKIKRLRKD